MWIEKGKTSGGWWVMSAKGSVSWHATKAEALEAIGLA